MSVQGDGNYNFLPGKATSGGIWHNTKTYQRDRNIGLILTSKSTFRRKKIKMIGCWRTCTTRLKQMSCISLFCCKDVFVAANYTTSVSVARLVVWRQPLTFREWLMNISCSVTNTAFFWQFRHAWVNQRLMYLFVSVYHFYSRNNRKVIWFCKLH